MLVYGHQVIRLPPGFREPSLQELVKRFQILHPPVLSRPHFAQATPQFNELGVTLCLFALLPRQNLVNFGQHEQRALTIELRHHLP